MPQPNGTAPKTNLIVNDGEGISCEHCGRAKDDVIALTVGTQIIFVSQECLVEAMSSVIETGNMVVLM